jgi:hypothetical protein
MTAELLTANNAQSDARKVGPGTAHQLHAVYGKYDVAANVEVGDTFNLCKIPAGFLVLGGNFRVGNMDTDATETLDLDIGWIANGTAAAATFIDANDNSWTDSGYAADSDGFVNSGVFQGDAVTDIIAAAANIRPFPMATGPLYFHKETTVQVYANAVAATFNAAAIYVELYGVFINAGT